MPRRRPKSSKPLDLCDLLGRKPVNLDTPELQRFLAGKRVMVTGAGGSIGSEICRQTMKFCPDRLLLVEQAENALFEVDRELRHTWVGADIRPYVCDVTDAARVEQVFAAEKPQVIFHAAAHKHVPMMELNPGEAIKNNVFGTKVLADAAALHRATAFVMISTDKAVNPSSVMGASKRVAEMIVSGFGEETPILALPEIRYPKPETRFCAVRFGNVLGSSGSVVPIFQRQIDAGGPVTVTHSEMTRYFMTIPEASQLVMQAGAIGQGGEIFVLDMGKPMKIVDLARDMIRRNGLRVGRDIELRFSGIRPGEKLFEELAGDDEQTRPTSHEKIRVWQLPTFSRQQVARSLEQLAIAAKGTKEEAIAALMAAVPEYRPGHTGTTMAAPAMPRLRLVTEAA
jgi:FlaA1/EpsC-like NDP-sugar epimerase